LRRIPTVSGQRRLPFAPAPRPTAEEEWAEEHRKRRAVLEAALAAMRAAKTQEEKDSILRAVAEGRFRRALEKPEEPRP
jgi:hypothetical protein